MVLVPVMPLHSSQTSGLPHHNRFPLIHCLEFQVALHMPWDPIPDSGLIFLYMKLIGFLQSFQLPNVIRFPEPNAAQRVQLHWSVHSQQSIFH